MKSSMLILIGFVIALMCGCATKNKSVAMGSSSDAFELTVYNPKTANTAPELIAGGGCFGYVSTKAYSQYEHTPTTIVFSQRTSLWDLFKAGATNKVFIYVAGSEEDSKTTLQMIEKLKGLLGNHDK